MSNDSLRIVDRNPGQRLMLNLTPLGDARFIDVGNGREVTFDATGETVALVWGSFKLERQ